MKKSKLLVLGGSGLVGSSFINTSKTDYDIIFSYNTNKIKIPNTQSFQIDLFDNDKIKKIIKNYNPDIVLHTIAHSSVDLVKLIIVLLIDYMLTQQTKLLIPVHQ